MKPTRLEVGFERLLAALERDLLDATDEEILAVAHELGMNPSMKGSIALFGVTFAARLKDQTSHSQRPTKTTPGRASAGRSRRRPKGNSPSSS
jgi:hypothetical protein